MWEEQQSLSLPIVVHFHLSNNRTVEHSRLIWSVPRWSWQEWGAAVIYQPTKLISLTCNDCTHTLLRFIRRKIKLEINSATWWWSWWLWIAGAFAGWKYWARRKYWGHRKYLNRSQLYFHPEKVRQLLELRVRGNWWRQQQPSWIHTENTRASLFLPVYNLPDYTHTHTLLWPTFAHSGSLYTNFIGLWINLAPERTGNMENIWENMDFLPECCQQLYECSVCGWFQSIINTHYCCNSDWNLSLEIDP